MTTSVTTPVLYALGTLTTVFSFVVILCSLLVVRLLAETGALMACVPMLHGIGGFFWILGGV